MKWNLYIRVLWLMLLSGTLQASFAQPSTTEISNLQRKYWYYRYRLLSDFVVVGGGPGHSLCATKRLQGGGTNLSYGDATIAHGWYLGVLATEYKLLASNSDATHEELQQTLTELYFAMQTINRLDLIAEEYYGQAGVQLNGFFVRSDNESDFLDQLFSVQDSITNDSLLNSNNIGIGPRVDVIQSDAVKIGDMTLPNGQCWPVTFDAEESQDQFINLTFGLAFIIKCLPDQAIFLDAPNLSYNFHDEAVVLWERLLGWVAGPAPGNTVMPCDVDGFGNTVQGFQANGTLSAAAIAFLAGYPVAGAAAAFAVSELDKFLIYNPATEQLAHRGAFAWPFSQPMVQGFEEMTGLSGPSPVSWSGTVYELNAPGFSQDNDAMSSVLGTICDCWGANTVNKLTLFGSMNDRNWQNFYVPALKFLHDKDISVSDFTDDLFDELSVAPCYGPAYFTTLNEPVSLDHRDPNNTNTDQFYNSQETGWGGWLRYYKDHDQQYRTYIIDEGQLAGKGAETVGFLPGLDFMLAHNIYLLSVNENNAGFNSFYRNRFSIFSEDVFPKTYNYFIFPNVMSNTVGDADNPLQMYAFESINSWDVIGSDGVAEYRAGQSIVLEPGSHIDQGADVWIHILPFDCTGGVTNNNNGGYDGELTIPDGMQRKINMAGDLSVHERIIKAPLVPYTHAETSAIEGTQPSGPDIGNIHPATDHKAFTLYPNPSKNSITLSWIPEDGEGQVVIYDVLSCLVYSTYLKAGAGKTTIDISALPPGMYVVQLNLPAASRREKFIKL